MTTRLRQTHRERERERERERHTQGNKACMPRRSRVVMREILFQKRFRLCKARIRRKILLAVPRVGRYFHAEADAACGVIVVARRPLRSSPVKVPNHQNRRISESNGVPRVRRRRRRLHVVTQLGFKAPAAAASSSSSASSTARPPVHLSSRRFVVELRRRRRCSRRRRRR